MKVLFTAFKNTSSQTLVKNIHGCEQLILENDKIKSVKQLKQALQKENYRYIFSFGQRPLIKDKIHIENRTAAGGEMINTSFDVPKLKKAFEDIGVTVKLSNNAGTSYCNNIYFYGMKMLAENYPNTEMVFIHVPYTKNISCCAEFFKSIEKGIINYLSEDA